MNKTPAKSKSHYFVQKYDLEDGYRVCSICNTKFKPDQTRQIYCSEECYKKAVKVTQRIWYRKNRERLIAKQIAYNNERRPPPKYKFNSRTKCLLEKLEFKKTIIIKKELIKKGLMSYQLLSKFIKRTNKKNMVFRHNRRGVNKERVEYIKRKLKDYDLPDGYSTPVDFPESPEIDIREPEYNTGDRCNLYCPT